MAYAGRPAEGAAGDGVATAMGEAARPEAESGEGAVALCCGVGMVDVGTAGRRTALPGLNPPRFKALAAGASVGVVPGGCGGGAEW